jgi:protoporphyrinogen/coproporphyrinogen III oxidase
VSRIVVVGGGIAGLSAAWYARTQDPRAEVTLIEKDGRLGGKIRTEEADGFLLEAGPDSFLARKTAVIRLSEELGIADRLVARVPRAGGSYIAHRHALFPFPEGFSGMVPSNLDSLASHPLLSEQGRRRALREPSVPPGPEGEDESIAGFMTRRFGEEVFRLLVEPMVSGIYSGDAAQLSLEATFPGLRALEKRQGSLVSPSAASPPGTLSAAVPFSRPAFVSFPRGTEELVRALAARLDSIRLILGVGADGVAASGAGFRVRLVDGSVHEADAVIVATPAQEAARLLRDLDPELCTLVGGIGFASSAVVHLAYRAGDVSHPLDGYGYLIPREEAGPLIACTWTSRKWEGRAPAGAVLLRLYAGGSAEMTGVPDAELAATARGELAATMGISAEPLLVRLHRWDKAMPRYSLGHPRRVAAIDQRLARHAGLFLAGASYRGVGIPDCIESGRIAALAAIARAGTEAEKQ